MFDWGGQLEISKRPVWLWPGIEISWCIIYYYYGDTYAVERLVVVLEESRDSVCLAE